MKNKYQLILAFLLISYASTAILTDSTLLEKPEDQQSEDSSISSTDQGSNFLQVAYEKIDIALLDNYSEHLLKSQLKYAAVVRKQYAYQFLAIYQNTKGKYMAITSWKPKKNEVVVESLVRVGKGAECDFLVRKSVDLNVNLHEFEFNSLKNELIAYERDGRIGLQNDIKNSVLVEECKDLSDHIRRNLWHYVDNADVIYSTVRKTDDRNRCMFIYVNIVGTFFVIGDEEISKRQFNIRTFVRLGQGAVTSKALDYKLLNKQKEVLKL